MRNHILVRWLAACILLALCGCSNSGTSPNSTNSSSNSGDNAVPAPPPAPPVTIAAGTVLTVTIDQSVSTKTNNSGDRFAASLAEPVTVDGHQVLPVGARASGTVTDADAAGHIKGGALLSLSLDSLTVAGQKYSIDTAAHVETIKGRGTRTAEGAGGGAAVGAIIGAIAGGGKGAAIGGLAGAGAGTAGTAYTGKRDITIPAETRLRFRLTKPVSVSVQ